MNFALTTENGKHTDTTEKFPIYNLSKQNQQLNESHAITKKKIVFDTRPYHKSSRTQSDQHSLNTQLDQSSTPQRQTRKWQVTEHSTSHQLTSYVFKLKPPEGDLHRSKRVVILYIAV